MKVLSNAAFKKLVQFEVLLKSSLSTKTLSFIHNTAAFCFCYNLYQYGLSLIFSYKNTPMKFFLFTLLLVLKAQELKKKDLEKGQSEQPFLVFLYYNKENFFCPLCEKFKEELPSIGMKIKTINFAKNVELASRFLQHTFPAFVIRFMNKSYVVDPKDPEELRNIISSESWLDLQPVKSTVDVNSLFAILFSKANRLLFMVLDLYYFLMNYVPDYVVSIFILCVISYLIYSIIDVLKAPSGYKVPVLSHKIKSHCE